ncbi:hypothetical protein INR49_019103 [Caranx melampygus]|nr:hypothetical protein INR49_019103 [Caranx melampygus]
MEKFLFFLLLCHSSSAVKHTMKFFSTVSDGVTNLPEAVAVELVNGVQTGHCDSNINTVQVKQTWMQQALDENPAHLQWYSGECFDTPNFFKASIQSLKRRFNQSEGVHIFQRFGGCEWDDETGEVTGFQQYGYNGEDFMSLDMKTETWIAAKPQAVVTKLRWDADRERIKRNEYFFKQICPEWLKMYLNYENKFLQRTEDPSSPVSCHATGFYPHRALLFWTKDGEELHEDPNSLHPVVLLHLTGAALLETAVLKRVKQRHLLAKPGGVSRGVHILQRMSGCEWDDETGEVTGFLQFGYDGEDFISFDLETLTWVAAKPQAVVTKQSWDADRVRIKRIENFFTQICPQWLKMYLNCEKSSLLRTVSPSVSLLQKTPSSPVSCHATGFYPHRALLFWTKDGEELHEDVDQGEILPNHDGTFQMTVDLDVSSVKAEDWRRYDCVFQLSGVKDDIVTKLDKAQIRTNMGKSDIIRS